MNEASTSPCSPTSICWSLSPGSVAGTDGGDPRSAPPGIPVIGEIELFAWALRDLGVRARRKVIAITGTNGKTTDDRADRRTCAAPPADAHRRRRQHLARRR